MESDPKPNTAERFTSKILTPQEYASRNEAFPTPYVLDLAKEDKRLVAIGVRHSTDPNDPQFQLIKQKLSETKPDLVLIEGFGDINERMDEVRPYVESHSFEEVIQEEGESRATAWLAIRQGIDVYSPEPSDAAVFRELQKRGHTSEEIFLLYMFKAASQWDDQEKPRPLHEYLAPMRQELCEQLDLSCSGDVLAQIRSYAAECSLALSERWFDDERELHDLADPIPWEGKTQTPITEAAAGHSHIRDTHLLRELDTAFVTHDRVFVVYGASHMHMLSEALKEYMSER